MHVTINIYKRMGSNVRSVKLQPGSKWYFGMQLAGPHDQGQGSLTNAGNARRSKVFTNTPLPEFF